MPKRRKPRTSSKYKVQVGTGLGLVSRPLTKKRAEQVQRMVDKGGFQSWVIPHHPKQRRKKRR